MAIPLEITLYLHRLRGWRFARFQDGDGNYRLYFCLPMLENGIEAIGGSKRKKGISSLSRTRAVFMRFRAVPSPKEDRLYSFALSLPNAYYLKLIEMGMQPQNWYRQAIGKITKWFCFEERMKRHEHRKRGTNKDTCVRIREHGNGIM